MNTRYKDIHNIPMSEISKVYGSYVAPRKRFQQGAKPKFTPGSLIGELTIVDYIGYSSVHPEKGTILSKEHHWYHCACSCRSRVRVIKTQQQLVDKRHKNQCNTCVRKSK